MSSKRLKLQPILNSDEFFAVVNQIADLEATAAFVGAERDREVQTVQARFAARLAGLDEAIQAKLALADTYARAHRSALLPKGRKSLELAQAVFGFRTGNRTVKFTGRKITPAEVIARLKAAGLGRFIRTSEEIAKDRILAESTDGTSLPLPTERPGETGGSASKPLADLGLAITQAESFFIEPKAVGGETLRPAQAA